MTLYSAKIDFRKSIPGGSEMFEGLEKRSEKVFSVVGWPFRADGVGWNRLGLSMNPGLHEDH